MDRSILQVCVNADLTQRDIAQRFGVAQVTVAHWLKKFGMRTNRGWIGSLKCRYCGTKNSEDFEEGARTVCKNCQNKKYTERWLKLKKWAVGLLGGKCRHCGYNKYYGALEFHHRNPKEKEFMWSKLKLQSKKTILRELKKCVLLCSNCHREHEAGLW